MGFLGNHPGAPLHARLRVHPGVCCEAHGVHILIYYDRRYKMGLYKRGLAPNDRGLEHHVHAYIFALRIHNVE